MSQNLRSWNASSRRCFFFWGGFFIFGKRRNMNAIHCPLRIPYLIRHYFPVGGWHLGGYPEIPMIQCVFLAKFFKTLPLLISIFCKCPTLTSVIGREPVFSRRYGREHVCLKRICFSINSIFIRRIGQWHGKKKSSRHEVFLGGLLSKY